MRKKKFTSLLHAAKTTTNQGTTQLIQGAPGAGKTALLKKLSDIARSEGWLVVKSSEKALYDPRYLAVKLGERYQARSVRSTEVGVDASFVFKKTRSADFAGESVEEVLIETARKSGGLVLVMDEIQTLDVQRLETADAIELETVLKAIHNGELGAPVMLLAAGLSNASNRLEKAGVSRFELDCLVHLQGLPDEHARAVIRDWLVDGGEARDDVSPWVDAIAAESHGWPHHIIAYAGAAATLLLENDGQMTPALLGKVWETGRRITRQYYARRTRGFNVRELTALVTAIRDHADDRGHFHAEGVIDALRELKGINEEQAGEKFNQAVRYGAIQHTEESTREYTIPIPSLMDYMFGKTGVSRTPRGPKK